MTFCLAALFLLDFTYLESPAAAIQPAYVSAATLAADPCELKPGPTRRQRLDKGIRSSARANRGSTIAISRLNSRLDKSKSTKSLLYDSTSTESLLYNRKSTS